jgi:hypothetical protein
VVIFVENPMLIAAAAVEYGEKRSSTRALALGRFNGRSRPTGCA